MKRAETLQTPCETTLNSENSSFQVKKYLSRSLLKNGH